MFARVLMKYIPHLNMIQRMCSKCLFVHTVHTSMLSSLSVAYIYCAMQQRCFISPRGIFLLISAY